MASGPPLVSIVIVNYNALEYLRDCLDSVLGTKYPNYEVIVVDNNSSDGSREIARRYTNITLIENEENKGFAEGCNIGIGVARGTYITLLNPDTTVKETWLNPVIETMEKDSSIGIAQSKLLLMDRENVLDDTGMYLDFNGFFVHPGLLKKDDGEFDKLVPIFSAKGAAMTIRTSLLKDIGTLDTDFFAYLEESDLCWRAWLRNFKVIFVPASIVYHAWGASSPTKKAVQFTLYLGTRNRIMMLTKNLQARNIPSFLLRNVGINLLMSVFFLSTGRATECKMIMKGILWNVRHIRIVLKKRTEVQRIRTAADRQYFPFVIRRQSLIEFYKYHNNFVKPQLSEKRRYS